MNSEYALVLLLIVFFPLLLGRDRKIGIVHNPRALLKAMVPVCTVFWIWDVIATARGHWSFNPAYVLGLTIMGMPLEEWLFFPVVAYVSVFTWESVQYFVRGRRGKRE